MAANSEFVGWVASDPSSVDGNMAWTNFEPKQFAETDIEMDVTHCGVCGSDIHALRSGWGPSIYPLVVGHEIVGKVTRVGSDVKGVKVGDRMGIGAQTDSCHDCQKCTTDRENYCKKLVVTYNSKYPSGETAFGGYAKKWRGPADFAFHIPDALPSEIAAPLLCGGLTVWSPLRANGAGPGKRVGVIGVGGLGHFAVSFAKALGSDKVVAISRKANKKDDALKMGADEYIATDDDPEWASKNADTLDLIICTVSGNNIPMAQYLQLLDVNGTIVQVGAPEDPIPGFSAHALIGKGIKLAGSMIGNRRYANEMLEFAAKNKITAWVQVRPMNDANQVIQDMEAGKARYRYVLQN
ncbi:GroES-like protein [Corynespora cassiicola Philippines]|uniref:alcohol dehydrogenase (NADP(+)) n=1 Tax=Corynespora cassiicola Philippines TaxID=1448308 RepID=A0A2T2NMZ2_CORCC|nr:GroES-like protein [Corynespora cassiicola Philippines]